MRVVLEIDIESYLPEVNEGEAKDELIAEVQSTLEYNYGISYSIKVREVTDAKGNTHRP